MKCPICNNDFYIKDKLVHVNKAVDRFGRIIYCCSFRCLNKLATRIQKERYLHGR